MVLAAGNAGDLHVPLDGIDRVLIEDCAFHGIGTRAVSIDGTGCTVRRCTFEDIGATGVDLRGGERATLAPGGNAVEDCTFTRCGRVLRLNAGRLDA